MKKLILIVLLLCGIGLSEEFYWHGYLIFRQWPSIISYEDTVATVWSYTQNNLCQEGVIWPRLQKN